MLLVPAGSDRFWQVVMPAKAADDYLSNLPADLILEIYQWLPFWDAVSLCLTSKTHLTMTAEALQAAQRHNPNPKHGGCGRVDSYPHSMARTAPKTEN